MTLRSALVLVGGRLQELPLGDTLAGVVSGATVSVTTPAAPTNGMEWVDASSGLKYTWVEDGEGAGQWVELGAGGTGRPGPTGLAGVAGVAGVAGSAGAAGAAATVAVGTVTSLAPKATPTVMNSGTPSAAVLDFGIPAPLAQPPEPVLVGAGSNLEVTIAKFTLAANELAVGAYLSLLFMGTVSSTATLTYRVRIGTTGTASDQLAVQFATSAAGAANAHTSGDIQLCVLTGPGVWAGGTVQLVNALLGKLTQAISPASVNMSVMNYISLTVQQSIAQSYTIRSAVLTRLR